MAPVVVNMSSGYMSSQLGCSAKIFGQAFCPDVVIKVFVKM